MGEGGYEGAGEGEEGGYEGGRRGNTRVGGLKCACFFLFVYRLITYDKMLNAFLV